MNGAVAVQIPGINAASVQKSPIKNSQARTLAFRFAPLPEHSFVLRIASLKIPFFSSKLSKDDINYIKTINREKGDELLRAVAASSALSINIGLNESQKNAVVETVKQSGVLSGAKAQAVKHYSAAKLVPIGLATLSLVSFIFSAIEPSNPITPSPVFGIVVGALALIAGAAWLLKVGKNYPGGIKAVNEFIAELGAVFRNAIIEVANKALP